MLSKVEADSRDDTVGCGLIEAANGLGRLKPRRGATEESQEARSQVMPKITGTESSVATKIVSRAKITPRS